MGVESLRLLVFVASSDCVKSVFRRFYSFLRLRLRRLMNLVLQIIKYKILSVFRQYRWMIGIGFFQLQFFTEIHCFYEGKIKP